MQTDFAVTSVVLCLPSCGTWVGERYRITFSPKISLSNGYFHDDARIYFLGDNFEAELKKNEQKDTFALDVSDSA